MMAIVVLSLPARPVEPLSPGDIEDLPVDGDTDAAVALLRLTVVHPQLLHRHVLGEPGGQVVLLETGTDLLLDRGLWGLWWGYLLLLLLEDTLQSVVVMTMMSRHRL